MRFAAWKFAVAGLAVAIVCGPARGADAVFHANVTSETVALLTKTAKALDGAKSVEFEAANAMKVRAQGQKQDVSSDLEVVVSRPGKFRIDAVRGSERTEIVSNGTTLTAYSTATKGYREDDAPDFAGDFEPSDVPEWEFAAGHATGIIAGVVSGNLLKYVSDGVTSGVVKGKETVDGEELQHVALDTGQGVELELWLANDERALPRRLAIDLSRLLEQQMGMKGDADEKPEMRLSTEFQDWVLDGAVDEARFAYVPPAGTKKITLADLMGGGKEGPHPMVGEAAPDFTLPKYGGGEQKLADLKDKVVVLDFWASWCGPCVKGLPKITSATAEFADKGVVFFAVNQGEKEDKVKAFLDKQGLGGLPVLLDEKGDVGEKYGVRGIPQTVVIGKDGKVQVVHVGFGPGMDRTLKKELADLLAGKDLAAETLAAAKKSAAQDEAGTAKDEAGTTAPAGSAAAKKPEQGGE